MNGRTILAVVLIIVAVLFVAPLLWMTGMMGMMGLAAPGLGGGWLLLAALVVLGALVLLSVWLAGRGTWWER